MTQVLAASSQIMLLLAACYGWGSLVNRWAGGCGHSSWAYLSALGIAVLIAMGGVLNAAGLAVPVVLLPLMLAGAGMAAFFIFRAVQEYRRQRPAAGLTTGRSRGELAGYLAFYALILLVFFFLVKNLMPAGSFNFHDDFHIYMMWPVKMLQTGTLGGNPFDHIGISSLGAQSFMQGLLLTFSPLANINAFDAIFCLVLSLGLLKELGERMGVHIVFILAAAILALFINPHYANVSSLYSGTLMLLGLTYATLLLLETLDSSDSPRIIPAAVVCSLFFAAFLALKTTYVFTAPLFWAASLIGALLLLRRRKQVLWAHAATAAGTVVLLLPWAVVHLDHYLRKINYMMHNIAYPKGNDFSAVLVSPNDKRDVLSQLFSAKELFYGNTYLDYLAMVVMLCFALVAAGWVSWQQRDRGDTGQLAAVLALLIGIIFTYLFYYKETYFPARLYVRYTCPLLIAAVPVAVLLAGRLWGKGYSQWRERAGAGKTALVIAGLLLTFQLVFVGTFGQTFVDRVKRAANYGTLISFPLAYNPIYINYNEYALGAEAGKMMAFIQGQVTVGESILAWVSMPMHLDYRRNRIFSTFEHGISNGFLVMPLVEGKEEMRNFFRQRGIRYFIWEYEGYGMKNFDRYGGLQRQFAQTLMEFMPASNVLYNDGNIVVFDIGPGN